MITLLVLIVVLIFFWMAFYYFLQDMGNVQKTEIVVSRAGTTKRTLKVETAIDPISQARGLSGRRRLSGIDGMLFVFDASKVRRFWMMAMRFPLDIVWIKDGAVIGIEYDALPYKPSAGAPKIYESPGAIDEVLELPAGAAAEMDLQIGDKITPKP